MATSHSGTPGHKRARARLIAGFAEGDRCARCGDRMYSWQHPEADHLSSPHAVHPEALPDVLSHRACNRYAGAVLAGLLRGVTIGPHRNPRMERVRINVIAQWNARTGHRAIPEW